MRWHRLIVGAALVLLWGPQAHAQRAANPSRPSDAQIQAAINRGAAFLRSKLTYLDGGRLSLATTALLKSGVPADAPELKAAIQKIAGRISGSRWTPVNLHEHIYEAGVTIMALANADPVEYKRQIELVVAYIIANQGPEGDWDYPQRGTGDTSISQYAILGLWEAVRSGVTVPKRVWDKAAAWHVTRQLMDGSSAYHPTGPNSQGTGTLTMTTAATGTLHVCRLHLYPDARDVEAVASTKRKASRKKYGLLEPADAEPEAEVPALIEQDPANFRPNVRLASINMGISRGLDWLAPRFIASNEVDYRYYFLYGIERLAALADIQQIGNRNWFDEGAAYLVASQAADGSWSDQTAYEASTSFGILFLSRATFKMLRRGPPRRDPRFGAGLLAGGRGLPENLDDVRMEKGDVKVRKIKGSIDELLTQLEGASENGIESTQTAIVESVVLENPAELIGQKDRLRKLAADVRPEVRRTAFWALGRTNDLRMVPLLIDGLSDSNLDCMVEARNALNFISKKLIRIELSDQPTESQRKSAIAAWRRWYQSVRVYDERDDLTDAARP